MALHGVHTRKEAKGLATHAHFLQQLTPVTNQSLEKYKNPFLIK